MIVLQYSDWISQLSIAVTNTQDAQLPLGKVYFGSEVQRVSVWSLTTGQTHDHGSLKGEDMEESGRKEPESRHCLQVTSLRLPLQEHSEVCLKNLLNIFQTNQVDSKN